MYHFIIEIKRDMLYICICLTSKTVMVLVVDDTNLALDTKV